MTFSKMTILVFSTVVILIGISLTVVGARLEIHTLVLVGIVAIITGMVCLKPAARIILRHLESRDD